MAEVDVKSAPDKDELQVSLGPDASQKKVELDLDDAPFLAPEEDETSLVDSDDKNPVPVAAPEDSDKKKKKKKLIILGAAALVLVLLAAVWWFFLRKPPAPPPEGPKPDVVVVPSQTSPADKPDFVKELEPFLVERQDGKKASRFLVCKFSTLAKNPNVGREIDQKMISLRDALYYYLRSKGNDFLLAPENTPAIKKDLTAVINGYLTQGEVDDVLFESYLNQ